MRGMSVDVARDVPVRARSTSCTWTGIIRPSMSRPTCARGGRRVRSGGILAGHDFYDFAGAGVVEAVQDFVDKYGIRDWWICDEREPSFWWGKP
jgi:hypothetical protein